MTTQQSFIMDTREPLLQEHARNRDAEWRFEQLTLSRFCPPSLVQEISMLTYGDLQCGDATNEQGTCIAEIKRFDDAMDVEHLIQQCYKMAWTGAHAGVFIYDFIMKRHELQDRGILSYHGILQCEHRLQCSISRLGIPVFYCLSERELFDRLEWFLEHGHEGPKPANNRRAMVNAFPMPVHVLAGIRGIGPVRAWKFLELFGDLASLGHDVHAMSLEAFVSYCKTEHGIGDKLPAMVWTAFHEVVEK